MVLRHFFILRSGEISRVQRYVKDFFCLNSTQVVESVDISIYIYIYCGKKVRSLYTLDRRKKRTS